MSKHSKNDIQRLCERLQVGPDFLDHCLRESVIEIHEINGELDLGNGTVLYLRRLERICSTFDVDVPTALLLQTLRQRVRTLEEEIRTLRHSNS